MERDGGRERERERWREEALTHMAAAKAVHSRLGFIKRRSCGGVVLQGKATGFVHCF